MSTIWLAVSAPADVKLKRQYFPSMSPRYALTTVVLPLSPAHSLADVDDVVAAVRRLHAHFTR